MSRSYYFGVSPREEAFYKQIIDETNPDCIYVGISETGTLESEAKWRIRRIRKINNITYIEYAGGSLNFDKVWTNRASYEYK